MNNKKVLFIALVEIKCLVSANIAFLVQISVHDFSLNLCVCYVCFGKEFTSIVSIFYSFRINLLCYNYFEIMFGIDCLYPPRTEFHLFEIVIEIRYHFVMNVLVQGSLGITICSFCFLFLGGTNLTYRSRVDR